VLVLALASFALLWFFVLRDNAPPPVSLEGALAAVALTPNASATPAPAADATGAAAARTPEATAVPAASAGDPASLVGSWTLRSDGESFVGYRVREELARIGATTAVGRTTALTGSLQFDGSAITVVSVEADLSRLRSDDSRRDRTLGRQGLETNTFPMASFVLSSPIEVSAIVEGAKIATTVTGQLTLHGVTRDITLDLEGAIRADGLVVIVGSTDILFEDYEIERPTALGVISVENRAVIELQLVFEHA
jgi:polyisoprenoid-binding protein YceI